MSLTALLALLACAPESTGETRPVAVDRVGPVSGPSADQVCHRREEVANAPLSEDLVDLRERFDANRHLTRVVAITAPG